ncbi:MAG: hypothetical protein IKI47_08640, partial [Prevotella sp.]|nr:hypothetical protein [Prevotella sp.]
RDGRAVTFVSPDDVRYFQQIERFLEREIDKNALPDGLGEGPEYKAAKPSAGRGGRRRGGKGRGNGRGKGNQRQKGNPKRSQKEKKTANSKGSN